MLIILQLKKDINKAVCSDYDVMYNIHVICILTVKNYKMLKVMNDKVKINIVF